MQTMTIAEKIKQLRSEHNLTQTDLAKRIGIGQTSVANWESRENGLTLKHCRRICGALNITLADLFEGVD